jgi:hypothetical protein
LLCVNIEVLKFRLGRILAEEERDGSVDWNSIECRSGELLGELEVPIPLNVHEYLRGAERRRQDIVYGHAQRSQLLHFLRGH